MNFSILVFFAGCSIDSHVAFQAPQNDNEDCFLFVRIKRPSRSSDIASMLFPPVIITIFALLSLCHCCPPIVVLLSLSCHCKERSDNLFYLQGSPILSVYSKRIRLFPEIVLPAVCKTDFNADFCSIFMKNTIKCSTLAVRLEFNVYLVRSQAGERVKHSLRPSMPLFSAHREILTPR